MMSSEKYNHEEQQWGQRCEQHVPNRGRNGYGDQKEGTQHGEANAIEDALHDEGSRRERDRYASEAFDQNASECRTAWCQREKISNAVADDHGPVTLAKRDWVLTSEKSACTFRPQDLNEYAQAHHGYQQTYVGSSYGREDFSCPKRRDDYEQRQAGRYRYG
jgi:hypothetical protein